MEVPTQHPTQTFGDRAYEAIVKHVQHILKYEEDTLNDRDPEALHQMRVGMRRLRSDTTGFAAAIVLPKAASNRKIGKIARTLGSLRDIDVMQELLHDRLLPEVPEKEQKRLQPALKVLEKKRKHARKDCQQLLEGKAYNKFKGAIQEWLDRPSYHPFARLRVGDVLPDILLPPISKLLLEPAWWVGIPAGSSQSQSDRPELTEADVESFIAHEGGSLHELRKQVKRVRYLMTLFADLYSPTFNAYLKDMKELQGILGDIQDNCVMSEFLSQTLDLDLSQKTPHFAEQLERARHRSWKRWQTLQARYLSREIRQVFRSEVLRGFETQVELSETPPMSISAANHEGE